VIEVQDDTSKEAGYEASDILRELTKHDYKFYIIARKGRLIDVSIDTLGVFQNVLCVPSERSVD
jgi:hypothetical protein